jgi:hypothetical protein
MTAPGHRTSTIGIPPFVCRGRGGNPVHRPQPTAIRATRDRQREAIAERDAERRRRALWLDCERAPWGVVEGMVA